MMLSNSLDLLRIFLLVEEATLAADVCRVETKPVSQASRHQNWRWKGYVPHATRVIIGRCYTFIDIENEK